MATTTKTLTPTNQTVTLPDMTERPNNSVNVDGISKLCDATNELDSKISIPRVAQNANNDLPGQNHWEIKEHQSGADYNLPTNDWYYIMSLCGGDADYIAQIAIGCTTAKIAYRNLQNGTTWSSWEELALDSKMVSAYCLYDSGISAFSIGNNPPPNSNSPVCLVTRNIMSGAIYVVRYDNAGFIIENTLSGNAPSNGDAIFIQYFA